MLNDPFRITKKKLNIQKINKNALEKIKDNVKTIFINDYVKKKLLYKGNNKDYDICLEEIKVSYVPELCNINELNNGIEKINFEQVNNQCLISINPDDLKNNKDKLVILCGLNFKKKSVKIKIIGATHDKDISITSGHTIKSTENFILANDQQKRETMDRIVIPIWVVNQPIVKLLDNIIKQRKSNEISLLLKRRSQMDDTYIPKKRIKYSYGDDEDSDDDDDEEPIQEDLMICDNNNNNNNNNNIEENEKELQINIVDNFETDDEIFNYEEFITSLRDDQFFRNWFYIPFQRLDYEVFINESSDCYFSVDDVYSRLSKYCNILSLLKNGEISYSQMYYNREEFFYMDKCVLFLFVFSIINEDDIESFIDSYLLMIKNYLRNLTMEEFNNVIKLNKCFNFNMFFKYNSIHETIYKIVDDNLRQLFKQTHEKLNINNEKYDTNMIVPLELKEFCAYIRTKLEITR